MAAIMSSVAVVHSIQGYRSAPRQAPSIKGLRVHGCSLEGNAYLKGAAPVSIARATAVSAPRTSLTVVAGESRIGKKPVVLPAGTTFKLDGQTLVVKGSLGELSQTFPSEISITEEEGQIIVKKVKNDRKSRELHGLCRSLAYNMVEGCTNGWSKKLTLIGVGYRAAVQGQKLTLNLGYSNPMIMDLPEGVSVKVEGNVNLEVTGRDKALVGNIAANIRALRPPEPYKGKGVKYADEYIIRKEGKSGKK